MKTAEERAEDDRGYLLGVCAARMYADPAAVAAFYAIEDPGDRAEAEAQELVVRYRAALAGTRSDRARRRAIVLLNQPGTL